MIQARRAWGRRLAVLALPGVETDMVMIAPGREKGSGPHIEEQIEAHVIAIEADGALEIGYLEMNVPNARLRRDGCIWHGLVDSLNLSVQCFYSVIGYPHQFVKTIDRLNPSSRLKKKGEALECDYIMLQRLARKDTGEKTTL